jgi:hypothetical protein
MGRESWTSNEKFLCPQNLWGSAPKILSSCSKGPNIFVLKEVMIGIKNAEFYAGFKNINLPLWQKAPKKSYYKKPAIFGVSPNLAWLIREKIFLDLYYRMTKFSGAFPQRLWGPKIFFNSCSGLPTHGHTIEKC